jgi:two-component system sensor histidine kinase MtrB
MTAMPLARPARRRLALRARVSVSFALVSLLLTALLAATTFFLARTYMLDQRERTATRQAFLNARLVKNTLSESAEVDIQKTLDQLQGELNSVTLIHVDDRWYSSNAAVGPASIPADLNEVVDGGGAGRRRIAVAGTAHIVIGTPIVASNADYFEFVPLESLERTLRILAGSLAVASAFTAIAGAGVGWYASRRLLRPLERVSVAAVDLAGGHLDTRLDDEGDGDLEPLVRSFNDMAVSLQQRIEREARFASDVSHELRTPLTALSTAVSVVRAREADMPPRTRLAVDVLETQIRYFERLVLDLLEISRFDSDSAELLVDDVDALELVRNVVAGYDGVRLDVTAPIPDRLPLDRLRVERVLVNLLDNAEHHAGGATRVVLAYHDGALVLAVEDNGPGIAAADRERIFDRFWRGRAARQGTVKGTGLGLSLVAEHVKAHGGSVYVEAAPGGGARFVVTVPLPTKDGTEEPS